MSKEEEHRSERKDDFRVMDMLITVSLKYSSPPGIHGFRVDFGTETIQMTFTARQLEAFLDRMNGLEATEGS